MLNIKLGIDEQSMYSIDFIDELIDFLGSQSHHFDIYFPFPGSRLNGGRANRFVRYGDDLYKSDKGKKTDQKVGTAQQITARIMNNLRLLFERGYSVNLTLSTDKPTEESLADQELITTLDLLADQNTRTGTNNGIIYTTDEVKDWVETNWNGTIRKTMSVIRLYQDPGLTYLAALQQADKTVFRHYDIFNPKILGAIPLDIRERVYLIVNSPCRAACTPKIAKNHYALIAAANSRSEKSPTCLVQDSPQLQLSERYLGKLIEKGFTALKVGRPDIPSDVLISYLRMYVERINGLAT